MYSRRSHASLPSQPVNRAVQYLRRLSQDPPTVKQSNSQTVKQSTRSKQSVEFELSNSLLVMSNVLIIVNYCNKASNRIVPKQKELVVFWIPLSPEVSRLSPYTHAHQHMRTSRTFCIFAVHWRI